MKKRDDNADSAGARERDLIAAAVHQAQAILRQTGVTASGPAADSALAELSSDSFAGYQLVREIHRGGQGVVYQALQKSTKRKVAIKVMKEGPFAGSADKARFEREVQILGQLKHRNIVTIYDSGSAAGCQYFVMDYVPGQPLDVYMAAATRSIDETLRLFGKVCEAVNAAHLRGVIHRDLKPGNIRVDTDGEPRILDFGLARVATSEAEASAMTMTGQFVGSAPWASPEQAEGAPSKIDVRTDVYALGVILYQMLTSKFPYDVTGNMRDVLDNIMTAEPARPRTLRKQINDEVETITLKCLSKERERRYQTAGELGRDIQHYLSGEPIEAKRDSLGYVLRKRLKRHKLAIVSASAFVLAAVVYVVTVSAQSARIQRESEAASEINAFFNDMLAALDPMQLRLFSGLAPDGQTARVPAGSFRRGITVAEMMRRASANIEAKFAGKPRLEARARETIGITFQSLHLFDDAEEHLRTAFEIRRDVLGDRHPSTLRSILQLGSAIRDSLSGRADEAEPLVRSALDGLRGLYGREDPKTLTAARILALVLADQRRYDASDQLLRETLNAQRRRLGDEHRDTLMTMYEWSASKIHEGRETEGRDLARQVHANALRALGPDDSLSIMSQVLLGAYSARMGRYDETESLLRGGLENARRVLGEQHPFTYFAMRALARSLRGEDGLAEAEQLYSMALQGQRATVGDEYRETLATVANFARFLCARGRHAQAVELYEPFVDMLSRTRGDDDIATFHAMRLFALALWGAGREEESRDYTTRAIAGGKQLIARPDAPIADLGHVAWLLMNCAPTDLRDAESALPIAITVSERSGGSDVRIQSALSLAYEQNGDFEKAIEVQKQVLDLLSDVPSVRRRQALARIIKLYEVWDAAEPDKGYDAKAAEWRAKLIDNALPTPAETGAREADDP